MTIRLLPQLFLSAPLLALFLSSSATAQAQFDETLLERPEGPTGATGDPIGIGPLPRVEDCRALVQGKIARNYQGDKNWSDSELDQLCVGLQFSPQPAKCLDKVMHGGVEWAAGSSRWNSSNALKLCSGSYDADTTVDCFESKVDEYGWPRAIKECRAPLCFNAVQGRVAWNTSGDRNWNPANIERLCEGNEFSLEPAKCFQETLHGSLSSLAKWNWLTATQLCKGARNAAALTRCASAELGRRELDDAIRVCNGEKIEPKLLGKRCDYGAEDCNRCVENLPNALAPTNLDIHDSTGSFSIAFPSLDLSLRGHNQGIARLHDVVRHGHRFGRMVLSENYIGGGLHYAERLVESEGVYEGGVSRQIRSINATQEREHPGGIQAQGNLVAVAMEEPRPGTNHASVDIYHVSDAGIMHRINQLVLDGSRGEAFQANQAAASSVAFVKLTDGRYLLAVSGKKHGTQGIWFYQSEDRTIVEATRWKFLSFWAPPNGSSFDAHNQTYATFFGGASAMSFLSDCRGKIYLVTMNGNSVDTLRRSAKFKKKSHWFQLFEIGKELSERGDVQLELVAFQKAPTKVIQANAHAFRWAAGVFVDPWGNPVLMSTERNMLRGANRRVDGTIYH